MKMIQLKLKDLVDLQVITKDQAIEIYRNYLYRQDETITYVIEQTLQSWDYQEFPFTREAA